jgi:hypothetical protein
VRKVFGRVAERRSTRPHTAWERYCDNAGLDPVNADPVDVSYRGVVETTCQRCGLVMEGQFKRCIACGGDW